MPKWGKSRRVLLPPALCLFLYLVRFIILNLPGLAEDAPTWVRWGGVSGAEAGLWWPIGNGIVFAVLFLLGTSEWWWHWLPWVRGPRDALEKEKEEFASLGGMYRAERAQPNIWDARRDLENWQTTDFTREPEKSMRDRMLINLLKYLSLLAHRFRGFGVGTPAATKEGFDDKAWDKFLVSIDVLVFQRDLDKARSTWPLEEVDG